MLTYKRAYSGVKLSLCARAPDRNYDISCFPIGPKQMGIALYALSKALIAFRFCTRIGPQRRRYCHARPPATFFDTELSGCGSPPPRTLRASVSRTTIFIMPTRASVCSTGGRLQMVKMSKRSVGKLKSYEH